VRPDPDEGLPVEIRTRRKSRPRWAVIVLAAATTIHFVGFSWHSLRRLDRYTCFEDLDHFEHVLWSTLNGKLLYDFNLRRTELAAHFSPALLLLVPVYACWQNPRSLIFIQMLCFSGGAVPLFLLARRVLRNDLPALLVALAYLSYPPLNLIITSPLGGIHDVFMAMPLIFLLAHAIETKRRRTIVVLVLLLMSVKENMPLLVATWGVWLLARKQWRMGVSFVAGGVIWFVVTIYVIMPWLQYRPLFEPATLRMDFAPGLGRGMNEVIAAFFTRPGTVLAVLLSPTRLRCVFETFASAGFLALACPGALVPASPVWAQNLLAASESFRAMYRWHQGIIVPFVFIGTVYGLPRITRVLWGCQRRLTSRRPRPWAICSCLAGIVLASAAASGWWMEYVLPASEAPEVRYIMSEEQARQVDRLVELVPADASIIASFNTLNRFARRHHLGWLRQCRYRAWDYVAADWGLPVPKGFKQWLIANQYRTVGQYGSFFLYQRPMHSSRSRLLPEAVCDRELPPSVPPQGTDSYPHLTPWYRRRVGTGL